MESDLNQDDPVPTVGNRDLDQLTGGRNELIQKNNLTHPNGTRGQG